MASECVGEQIRGEIPDIYLNIYIYAYIMLGGKFVTLVTLIVWSCVCEAATRG